MISPGCSIAFAWGKFTQPNQKRQAGFCFEEPGRIAESQEDFLWNELEPEDLECNNAEAGMSE
jgi:hypothetical protein